MVCTCARRVRSRCGPGAPREAARHVLLDDLLELFGDALALERYRLGTVLVNGCDGALARAGQADAEVRMLALARSVYHASHDGDRHVLDAAVFAPPLRHAVTQMRLDALREFLEVC